MKRLMVPFIVLLLMVPLCAVPVAAIPTNIADSYSITNQDYQLNLQVVHPSAGPYSSEIGQSFTAPIKNTLLYQVQFFLKKSGSPTGNLVAVLYTHSGTYGTSSVPDGGAALATSQPKAASDLTTSYVLYTFTFTGVNMYELQANTKYCIVIKAQSSTIDATNYVAVGADNSGPSHAGNGFKYSTGAYAAITQDVCFYVTVTGLPSYYNIYFEDAVYENNTDAGSVTVTAHTINGTEEFTVDGADWWYGSELPVAFSWPVYSATRYIYVTAEENFTVTLPYDTIGVYSMTVKDKTATGGSTSAYLESYREIGGSETLVERMKIIFGNPTPLNLMVGSVYHIKVLFADGSRYDWGYFTATSTTSVNVIIRVVEFGDGAQMIYGTIHVDAERNVGTITIDYLDDRDNTIWANVTIRVRNGGIVVSVPYNISSYTFNWASANTSLGYTVVVEGEHTEFGVWGRSWIFDPTLSFPAFPTLTGIYGSASSDLLPFLLVAVTILIFSYKFQARGLLAGCLMASFLSLFGAASWSYYWLAFAWFIAVMVNINVGGEG